MLETEDSALVRIASAQDGVIVPDVGTGDMDDWLTNLQSTLGTTSDDLAMHILSQIDRVLPNCPDRADRLSAILAAIREIGPQNSTELTLAVQMQLCNEVALDEMARATHLSNETAKKDAYAISLRYLRMNLRQMDLLRRLRTQKQDIIVTHNYNYGVVNNGQAVIERG